MLTRFVGIAFLAGALAQALPGPEARAQALRAMPAPASGGIAMTIGGPADAPRDLNTHHLFAAPGSKPEWEARKRVIRRQILFSAGLWPMPKKTPLKPRVTGRIEGPDYIIENVAIETLPGFYLCGNLYKPKGKAGPFPGIANPHGHWVHGRLEMEPDVPIAAPAPAKPAPGRGNLVSIGVNLARQGFVVFAYDAVGYNDTNQVTHEFANGLNPWLWNVSLMGLQLWNSIRAVDYLQSLPDVDKNRIGATGASGGASQTFLLTAVDDRIKAAVPVNMVSAYMQGGCLCENGPGLRVGTDNVEVASTFAPKPLLMVACTGDWTKNNPKEEWPAVKKVYDLYGAGDRVDGRQFNYQHNYNVESREAMYAWFGKWLLNDSNPEHFKERPFDADLAAMHVWNDKTPLPADALKEADLTRALIDQSKKQLAELWPRDAGSLKRFQETLRPALESSLAAQWPTNLNILGAGGVPPRVALVVTEESDEASAGDFTQALRKNGYETETLVVKSPSVRPQVLWDNYFTCYNATPAATQVQRIVDQISTHWAGIHKRVDVVGVGRAGRLCLLARALTPNVGKIAVDMRQLDTEDDNAYLNELFAPGLRRIGDLRSAAMLAAPAPVYLYDVGESFRYDSVASGYKAIGASLRVEKSMAAPERIAEWLAAK